MIKNSGKTDSRLLQFPKFSMLSSSGPKTLTKRKPHVQKSSTCVRKSTMKESSVLPGSNVSYPIFHAGFSTREL